MRRSNKLTWTSNEFLAHKKNVSEDVKLRNTLTSLACRRALTKDAIRQDVGKVRTELRQLRRSTGHSMEALPPTPFRIMARKYSVLPIPDPIIEDESVNLPPEFHYMLDEVCSGEGEENDVIVSLDTTVKRLSSHNESNKNRKTREQRNENDVPILEEQVRSVTFYEPTHGLDSMKYVDMSLDDKNDKKQNQSHKSCEDGSADENHFPPIANNQSIASTLAVLNENLLKVPDWEITMLPCLNSRVCRVAEPLREDTKLSFSITPVSTKSCERSPPLPSYSESLSNEDTRALEFESPVSKQIMSILNEGEWKRREYVRKNSFVGLDVLATNAVTGQFFGNPFASNNMYSTYGKQSGRYPPQDDPRRHGEWRAYRDARTRCRTCMERFRQNAAFQRQRLELERQIAERQTKGRPETVKVADSNNNSNNNKNNNNVLAQKLPPSPNMDDLEQYFSEGVLDFDDDKAKTPSVNHRKNKKNKGYSRKRMDELAEPRGGTKRKTLFSKGLINKELDSLTKRHDHPHLTDRERERLRMLESKIRTFLATVQQGDRPTSMVHIPQREDIMKVDISHH